MRHPSICHGFFQRGLEIQYNGRHYVIRAADSFGVYVEPEFRRYLDDDRGPDLKKVDPADPLITVYWSHWNIRARAAHFLHTARYVKALPFLDMEDGRVTPAASEKLIRESMFRAANGLPPALGLLSTWEDNKHPFGARCQTFERRVEVSLYENNRYGIAASVLGPYYSGSQKERPDWRASWITGVKPEYTPKFRGDYGPSAPCVRHSGEGRGAVGMAKADELLKVDWVLS